MLKDKIIKKKLQKTLKSTQIAIKLLRDKVKINTNWRTQLNFEKATQIPRLEEREKKRKKKVHHLLTAVFSNTQTALINFAVIRHVGRHNDCFFFKAACTAQWKWTTSKHQSIYIFLIILMFLKLPNSH